MRGVSPPFEVEALWSLLEMLQLRKGWALGWLCCSGRLVLWVKSFSDGELRFSRLAAFGTPCAWIAFSSFASVAFLEFSLRNKDKTLRTVGHLY
jgi:hypothetical protein